jgi:hypothetical protein
MTHVVSDNRTFENVEFLNKNENHIIFFMTINLYFLDFDININLPFNPGYIFYLLWPGVSDENGNHGSVCIILLYNQFIYFRQYDKYILHSDRSSLLIVTMIYDMFLLS